MNGEEHNYAAHDLELYAIVDTHRTWRRYKHGRKIIVNSDHDPLCHLETQSNLPS